MAVAQKKTCPANIRKRPILRKKIWERLHHKDKNWMGITCGDTGSGKSMFSLRLCEVLDPDFSVDQVAFTIEEFMELVTRDAPQGSFIMFDEVGVALSHATHYDSDQIKLNHVLETWREQNRGLIMTAPHINLVQKASRGLLHAQLDMQGINYDAHMSHARYRYFQQNTDDGQIYKKHPRLRDPETGRQTEFKRLQLFLPSPELAEPYLERKREFNQKLNEEVLEQVLPDKEEEGGAMGPQEVSQAIVDSGRVEEFVSIHGGNKQPYVDADLIEMEYNLSLRDAKKAKKSLERHPDVILS